ncbi:hypothetical protein REH65_33460 (plasmid) [Saccharopolyspora sp. ID03-671]|uniref:hypothetical protein n=1 Tax=Saccharopolyspora sp. ID03-671 TaxID=3073066 RepID=UPI0030F3A5AA
MGLFSKKTEIREDVVNNIAAHLRNESSADVDDMGAIKKTDAARSGASNAELHAAMDRAWGRR